MTLNRRQFLSGVLAVGLAGCAVRASQPVANATAAGNGDVSIIDAHQHLWDLKQFRLPWLDSAGPRLNRNYTLADYERAVEGLNLVKAVYEEVAVTPDQRSAEADYVAELCRSRRSRTVAAVIGGDVASEGFEKYIRRFEGSPYIKGVRSGYRRSAYNDPRFVRGVNLLGDLGMVYDLGAGSDLLADAAKLAAACPKTRVVVNHCGNPNVKWFAESAATDERMRGARAKWEEGIARLAEHPNVICKISGVAESGDDGQVTAATVAPAVNYCLDHFGDNRVVFASNWPVCLKTISLAGWVGVLKEVVAPRGTAFSRKLFCGNATRVYGL